ncbi:hypothetical protein R1sor_008037 [Riccia sorocarpa]|uniref:Reverse transcriptase zinc-binding domain-containing protein n=1 Tax=Riccia sorocarpa TaxID=122646 RepID=A0ABD3HUD9_9MARC
MRLKHLLRVFELDTEDGATKAEDWVVALQSILQQVVAKKQGGRDRGQWKIQEILLTDCPQRIRGAPITSGLLTAWHEARRHLTLETGPLITSGETSINAYLDIAERQNILTREATRAIRNVLNRKRIRTVGAWMDWAWWGKSPRPLSQHDQLTLDHGLTLDVQSTFLTKLEWKWRVGNRHTSSWTLSTKTCKKLLTRRISGHSPMNRKWGRADSPRRWAKRLTKVWKSFLPPREKAWMWKLIQHGLPTLERIRKWRQDEPGTCRRCNREAESPSHLFWSCEHARLVWNDTRFLTEETTGFFPCQVGLIEEIDEAFRGNCPEKYFLLMAILRTIWLDRNTKVYTGNTTKLPLMYTLLTIRNMAEAQRFGAPEHSRKRRKMEELLTFATTIIDRAGGETDWAEDIPRSREQNEDLPGTNNTDHSTDKSGRRSTTRLEDANAQQETERNTTEFSPQDAIAPQHQNTPGSYASCEETSSSQWSLNPSGVITTNSAYVTIKDFAFSLVALVRMRLLLCGVDSQKQQPWIVERKELENFPYR